MKRSSAFAQSSKLGTVSPFPHPRKGIWNMAGDSACPPKPVSVAARVRFSGTAIDSDCRRVDCEMKCDQTTCEHH